MNLEKYKKDLESLIKKGEGLYIGMLVEYFPEQKEALKKKYKKKADFDEVLKKINFRNNYQSWYSEALEAVRQLLPSRSDDFQGYYRSDKKRKEISVATYRIEDFLEGLNTTRNFTGEVIVDGKAAIPKFEQQLNILKSLLQRFESSLFDIRQLVQADVFDNELEVADELLKKGFVRAAGAVAGVVLEGHLQTVCDNHQIKVSKKNASISDYNDLLKNGGVIDTSDWRKIQHLGDLRNTCDHKKKVDPKKEDIEELIAGVRKISKTLF
ncbi:MAG: hypothetical protein HGB37_04250 [Candidatus Moranbacteria bacterium]|nr:hypothetical protein [Candidatus Moranbacteria bacterium]